MANRRALTGDAEQQCWALWVRRVPRTVIAKHFGCNVKTVSATVERIQRELGGERADGLERAREEALAVYDEVQRQAFASREKCKPSSNAAVGYLSVIIDARRQMDRLLGLEKAEAPQTVFTFNIDRASRELAGSADAA